MRSFSPSLFYFSSLLILSLMNACQEAPNLPCETFEINKDLRDVEIENLKQLSGIWDIQSIKTCTNQNQNQEQIQFTLNLFAKNTQIIHQADEDQPNLTVWDTDINQMSDANQTTDETPVADFNDEGLFLHYNINRLKVELEDFYQDTSSQEASSIKYTVILENLKIQTPLKSTSSDSAYEQILEIVGDLYLYPSQISAENRADTQPILSQPFRMVKQ